mmetsp:Transcript_26684/g.87299  ORF Transcript_26684/g.87299 Transcript_26684/m.87299 type:complete len:257 (+) Transcript_26684:75-845(+)
MCARTVQCPRCGRATSFPASRALAPASLQRRAPRSRRHRPREAASPAARGRTRGPPVARRLRSWTRPSESPPRATQRGAESAAPRRRPRARPRRPAANGRCLAAARSPEREPWPTQRARFARGERAERAPPRAAAPRPRPARSERRAVSGLRAARRACARAPRGPPQPQAPPRSPRRLPRPASGGAASGGRGGATGPAGPAPRGARRSPASASPPPRASTPPAARSEGRRGGAQTPPPAPPREAGTRARSARRRRA